MGNYDDKDLLFTIIIAHYKRIITTKIMIYLRGDKKYYRLNFTPVTTHLLGCGTLP